jgi:SpoVK/Ycf46/Vps4 family AAA+-type ATPase
MIDNEAWLELAEVSPSTLTALQAKSGNALQVSVGSVSILVEALAGSNSNNAMEDSSILWIHPTLFDFLDEANELQDKRYFSQQDKYSASVQARLAPLPMEPPPAAAWSSILASDPKTTSISATLSKTIIQPIPDKSCLQITCVHLDPGVQVVVKNDDPTELPSLLSVGLQGRLVLVGAFLMSLTPHGIIILQVTGIQNSSRDRHQPIDTSISIAYRLGHSSSFALQIINPHFMIEDPLYEQEQEKSLGSKEQEWETNIPGYEPLLQDVDRLMTISTRAARPSGILITGCAGVGKTRLISCLCGAEQAAPGRVHWLSAQDLILRASTESDLLINLVLPPSSNCSLWVIDDLHLLARSEDADEYESTNVEYMLVLNAIVQAMDRLQQPGLNTTLIGIAQTASDLPKEITKIGRLEKEIIMHPPTQLQRTTIWELLLQRDDIAVEFQQPWASALAAATAGCVVADLVRIYQDAATRAWARGGDDEESSRVVWVWEDLQEAARVCVPSQLALLDVTKPTPSAAGLSWTEIHDHSWRTFGGYSSIRKRVFRHVVAPWRRFLRGVEASSLQVEKGMDPPPGVLFHGPSGCGKTFAAKCLAASLELPVIQVRAADVLDKWLGGSESILRSLFARARAAAPCILFLDEIDSIASNRSEGDSNDFTSRILSTFLNEMDGVSSAVTKSRVLVVACTNRLESLDAALLRPGRLEEHLHLELPSTEDLEEILKLLLALIPLDDTVNLQVLAQELYEKAASGADVEGLCREVCLTVLRQSTDPETVVVTQADIRGAIKMFRPE